MVLKRFYNVDNDVISSLCPFATFMGSADVKRMRLPIFRRFFFGSPVSLVTFPLPRWGVCVAAIGGAAHALQGNLHGWVSSAAVRRRGTMRPV